MPAIGVRMPTNDFKPFATSPGANVLSQADYNALTALLTGWQSGVAKSTEVNKAMRQATFIAAAIAQFVADSSGQDVLDDGSIANFVTKLKLANSSQYLGNGNNLSEISTAGSSAQLSAMANIGLARLGIGAAVVGSQASFDWQQFDFATGSNYLTNVSNWTNAPAGINFATGTGVSISVDYISAGNRIGLTVIPDTSSNPNYDIYRILCVGAKGSRVFTVRQEFTSADTIPLTSGGLGATTPAGGRTALGLGSAALVNVGTGSGQVPDMSSFASVKSTSGSQLLPSGLIRQWTQGTISTGGTISFPTAFPTALLAFSVIHGPGATGVVSCAVSTANRSGLQLLHNGTTNVFTVIAEGY